ncbi:hypothetical protein [Hyphomicrobium sp. MC1]|uniref:hypothetical protein n=1 Tax=Hyphomicrobium sp. (strain MC1) TaxID=717785 RepID=UPI0003136ABC|nr:hypothetical protein [Hyphomicrobium sp. MC1]
MNVSTALLTQGRFFFSRHYDERPVPAIHHISRSRSFSNCEIIAVTLLSGAGKKRQPAPVVASFAAYSEFDASQHHIALQ